MAHRKYQDLTLAFYLRQWKLPDNNARSRDPAVVTLGLLELADYAYTTVYIIQYASVWTEACRGL